MKDYGVETDPEVIAPRPCNPSFRQDQAAPPMSAAKLRSNHMLDIDDPE